jgi:urease accessory protein
VTVSITEVGRHGRLDIALSLQNGRTAIRHSYCEVPFKITRLLDADLPGFAQLILMQCTAGLFGGDQIESLIHVDAGARVVLTQQSATKIHPSRDLAAIQRTRIIVENGASAVVDFEPVIPFANSRLHQSTHIEVEPGASLLFWEGMMAGRIGRDERWQFAELKSETRLDKCGRPLYLDRVSLNPESDNPQTRWIMKDSVYVGTGLLFCERADQFAVQLHDAMPAVGVDILSPELVIVRVAVASGPEFHQYRETFRMQSANFVRPTGGDLDRRRLAWQ